MRRLLLSFCPKRYQKRRTGAVAGQRPGMLATAAVNILGSLVVFLLRDMRMVGSPYS